MDSKLTIAEGTPAAGSLLDQIGQATGGTVTEHRVTNEAGEVVHAFATMSIPLRKDHWIYQQDETSVGPSNVPPMPFRMGADSLTKIVLESPECGPLTVLALSKRQFEKAIRAAGKYAVRCATMNGSEMDFDPDALLQNLVVGFLGYWTETGLIGDPEDSKWCDPQAPFDFTEPSPRNHPLGDAQLGCEATGSNPAA